jgi:hypothetical protein
VTRARLNIQSITTPDPPGTTNEAPIRVPPGDLWVPQRFRANVRLGAPHNLAVLLRFEMVADVGPSVVELTVTPHFGPSSPVTSAMLRSIPVEALTREAIKAVAQPVSNLGGGAFVIAGDRPGITRFGPAPSGEATGRAAQIYADAVTAGAHNPTEVVAAEMNVSRSTASRYIREARILKLLPPARPGSRTTPTNRGRSK